MSTYHGLMPVYHSVLKVKILVGAFNKEKVLVGPFSMNVKLQSSRKFVASSIRNIYLHLPIKLVVPGLQVELGAAGVPVPRPELAELHVDGGLAVAVAEDLHDPGGAGLGAAVRPRHRPLQRPAPSRQVEQAGDRRHRGGCGR